MNVLDEHTPLNKLPALLAPVLGGKDAGLISEAGCPAVADPGSDLVRLAHEKQVRVVPLTGPSSILLSLMGSGLNGQGFAFAGYLPKEKTNRKRTIAELEKLAVIKNQTQIFIEAPYRNQHLLEDILQVCKPTTLLCLAVELTSTHEQILTRPVSEWKKNVPDIQKKHVVFLLGRQ